MRSAAYLHIQPNGITSQHSIFFSIALHLLVRQRKHFKINLVFLGFGDVFPSQPKIILVNMVSIVLGVVLFSMCYFILQEEIREKAFVASRKARMSISKYSHSIMLHTKNPWSRRNSPAFDHASLPEGSAFDQLKKRRQSAPVITIDNKKLAPP